MTDALQVGEDNAFEALYMAKLGSVLAPSGILIKYDNDLAALDRGLHLYEPATSGETEVGPSRVWIQAKGKRAATLTGEKFSKARTVTVSNLSVRQVQYWYAAPEAVYLTVYVESVDTFLAADTRELVDAIGGWQYFREHPNQKTMTLHVPTSASIARALDQMPRHRSMRIDGPAFRGRPLGHRYDPLRSELDVMPPTQFGALVAQILDAYGYKVDAAVEEAPFSPDGPLSASFGKLAYTYEWVLPMTTEFGFDEGSRFRIEGKPLYAHGDVLVIVDAEPDSGNDYAAILSKVLEEASKRKITDVLIFINAGESAMEMATGWRLAAKGFKCWPQLLGSVAFALLVTTNVYLDNLGKVPWHDVNYLY